MRTANAEIEAEEEQIDSQIYRTKIWIQNALMGITNTPELEIGNGYLQEIRYRFHDDLVLMWSYACTREFKNNDNKNNYRESILVQLERYMQIQQTQGLSYG